VLVAFDLEAAGFLVAESEQVQRCQIAGGLFLWPSLRSSLIMSTWKGLGLVVLHFLMLAVLYRQQLLPSNEEYDLDVNRTGIKLSPASISCLSTFVLVTRKVWEIRLVKKYIQGEPVFIKSTKSQ